jgi:Rps23 Pro-64 3,4-dihydroxylase Tpa1-like proline 4-hydroxylase
MRTINDFLSAEFIENIKKENQNLMYSSVWKTSLGWQKEIISPISSVLIRDLSAEQKETLLIALDEKNIVKIDQIEQLEAQTYLWQPLSFIPWHSDKEEDDRVRFAATLYLNDQWKDDWGGLFLFKDNSGIYAESPTYNKLVFNDNNYPHATTIISSEAPLRQTIQLFWKLK